jgi:transposase
MAVTNDPLVHVGKNAPLVYNRDFVREFIMESIMSSRPRGPQPLQIELSLRQQSALRQIVNRPSSSQGLVQRAQIILQANGGARNLQIAQAEHWDLGTVRKWRKRWSEAEGWLAEVEGAGVSDKQLREAIRQILADLPRSGTPAKFSAEQICQIIAVSCETPEQSGRPVTHWTSWELADEVISRGIVASISPRQVGRFLKGGEYQASSVPVLAD